MVQHLGRVTAEEGTVTKRPKSIPQRHLDAYRERCGEVGILLSCICCFPLERSDTTTAHDKNCPAHRMIVAARKADAK
jgi:hypothetical protein